MKMDRLYREQIIRIIVIIAGVIGFIAAVITLISFWPIIYKFLCSIPILSLCPLCPKPTINILDCPSSVYGGEELNVRVSWNNTPTGWKLVVSLQESETDYTRLTESSGSKIDSSSGEETFKLKVYPTTQIHDQAKICAYFYEGSEPKSVFDKKDVTVYPTRVSIFDCSPSPVHGGEKLSANISWNNIPTDWTLYVSLEESKTDPTPLACGGPSKIDSSRGNETFKLEVYPTEKDHDQAKVCAHAHFFEGTEWKNVFDKKDIKVLP